MDIPLSSPDLTDSDREAVAAVLRGRILSIGPVLKQFEAAISAAAATKFAIAVNSGTSGLHLCMKATGISDGDEVITTPFSFIASANSILFQRAVPVFVDIDPVSYNIDPGRIESAITPRTRAILPVHVFGRPCDMSRIMEIARRHSLVVIEDACEAIGATFDGQRAGSFGMTGVFAFYPNKQITTGEGGAIVTDDEAIALACRRWRNQGRNENSDWLAHQALGYNYRLSEINCALGLSQISRLPAIVAARARVATLYGEALRELPEVIPPRACEPGAEISWFVYVVRLHDDFTADDRDVVLARLRQSGIGCGRYFTPIHLQPFYREVFGFGRGDFPVTERIADRTIALPFFNMLTESEISYVCTALRDSIASLKRAAVAA